MRIKSTFFLFLFVFSCVWLCAQTDLPKDSSACMYLLKVKRGGLKRGKVVREDSSNYYFVSQKGVETSIPKSVVAWQSKRCPVKKTKIARPLPLGFFQQVSLGYTSNSFSEIFKNQTKWQVVGDYNFEPILSVQHNFAYNVYNGLCLSGGLGLEQFRSSFYYGSLERSVYQMPSFLTFPVFVGLQKHFSTNRKVHYYAKVDFGKPFNTQISDIEDFNGNTDLIKVKADIFAQFHLGAHFLLQNKVGMFLEFGTWHETIEYDVEIYRDALVRYAYNRFSLRLGTSF